MDRDEKEIRTLSAGCLIDGNGGPAIGHALVEVDGGEIMAIRDSCSEGELAAADVDLSSCTLLPGLCDCHVHLSMSGSTDALLRKRQLSPSYDESRKTIWSHLARHRAHGTIAVRDGGDRQAHALQYKRAELPGEAPIQVFSAGRAWHARGRYGGMIGRAPEGALAESIQESEKGDLIKIVNSGPNSLSEFGRETPPQFAVEDLRKAAACAHSLGLKVMVHANGRLPVQWAIEAGCDSIEHGYFMGKDNLRRMAELRIPWVPTVFAMQALRDAGRGTPAGETAARTLDHQLETIRLSREYGVIIALGTDAGSFGVNHGVALIEELRLFMSAGMSLEEALECGASAASDLLGLHRLGRLGSGNRAVFVAAQGGPDRLPESLSNPQWVFAE